MNLKLETEFSKAPILQEVDDLKRQIDAMRPLSPEIEGRVMQKLRLDWNYNSNAIEGNRLNYGETVAFLMEGITAKGKPLKDHLDIRGHNEAINFLLSIVKDTRPISEADIRALHKMILVEPYDVKAQTADGLPTTKRITLGEYKTLPNHVQTATGETHYYATPEETPAKMQELMEWYTEINATKEIHPVVAAALFHHKFVSIHPFDDGNGRLSRILMNLILMQADYPPVVVKMDDRTNYYSLLSRADRGDDWAFVEYIVEALNVSLKLYLKVANGVDINEDDDIDKEIALYRLELQSKLQPKKTLNNIERKKIIKNIILPFIDKLSNKIKELFGEFFEYSIVTSSGYVESTQSNIAAIAQENNIVNEIETLLISNVDIETFYLYIQCLNFKNPDNVFNVSTELEVGFEGEEYFLRDINNLNIYKFSYEVMSIAEQNEIILEVMNSLKYFIKEHTEN